jgi:hypothetical protein
MKYPSIPCIVEWPLEDLQTDKAKETWAEADNICCLCGMPIKNMATAKHVQYLTNGNIISTDEEVDNSQGFFAVGSECAKKLVVKFSF